MIIRGTTPYQEFELPVSADQVSNIYVTYFQENKRIFEKGMSEIEIQDLEESEEKTKSIATVHLTQEDTLKFIYYFEPNTRRNFVFAQWRIIDMDGEVYSCIPVKHRLLPAFKEGIITAH
jgi:hypothetical protein